MNFQKLVEITSTHGHIGRFAWSNTEYVKPNTSRFSGITVWGASWFAKFVAFRSVNEITKRNLQVSDGFSWRNLADDERLYIDHAYRLRVLNYYQRP